MMGFCMKFELNCWVSNESWLTQIQASEKKNICNQMSVPKSSNVVHSRKQLDMSLFVLHMTNNHADLVTRKQSVYIRILNNHWNVPICPFDLAKTLVECSAHASGIISLSKLVSTYWILSTKGFKMSRKLNPNFHFKF
jgi:hypothetical protein